MSSSFPPGGPQGPEYLEQGGGAPLPPRPPRRRSRSRRPTLVAGGAIAALLVVGGGVWAATWYLGSGPQPAEALPASTLGYVSIDLDPSGQQKIEALKTLNKFPAIKDQLHLNADDDIRRRIFEEIQKSGDCKSLDYDKDIAPWLGDRMAVAAVDTGEKQPQPVVVLQVTDEAAADAGLAKLQACDSGADTSSGSDTGSDPGSDTGTGGWSIDGDWAVVAESDATAKKVADAAAADSLADDESYQRWTGELGDPGVLSMYAAPAAGGWMADNLSQMENMFGGSSGSCVASADPFSDSSGGSFCGDTGMSSNGSVPSDVADALKQFKGMAATVRFNDGALELEGAADPGETATSGQLGTGEGGDDVLATLPSDTAAAMGFGFEDGWFAKLVDRFASYSGMTGSDLMDQMSQSSGLDLPADAETLAGDSMALAVGGNIDPETIMNSSDGSNLPVAVKIKGDPDAIDGVLGKLAPRMGSAASALESDRSGDMIAIGPDADYRSQVLEHGGLGDTAAFKDVVPEAAKASVVYYVSFDAFDGLVSKLGADSPELVANVKPLRSLGVSAWVDGGVSRLLVKLTTD
ncbi:DUF3352 domain-containing protein [Nocardioides panaciterrulae]|uniref:DUF3352 domain-containing protein n=1 Tax=Nocardioides panaciterrulae TaxID=661492 RepID=A0A7Y9E580_9ACTN|nr:hypothetical protein [Nocardioides panaciterrulae]